MEENNEKVHVNIEVKEKPVTCRGSFRIGTACGECARCKEAGFGPKEKAEAEEAERERTKDLPADRVKKDGYVSRKTEEQKQEEKAELKEEIKEELKPEIKEEIKDELKEEKEEEEKPVDPAPVDPEKPEKK